MRRSGGSSSRRSIRCRASGRRAGCRTATAYTTVEKSPDRAGASDIVRYDAGSGARTVLVAGSRLVPPGASTALDIDDYVWSADGRRLLIFTNTRKVWRDNTRGDYWVLDVASGGLKQVGHGAPGGVADVCQVLARRQSRRVRARQRHLRRADRRRAGEAADEGRIGDHDQRHVRLGLRRGARRARRVPLEPRRLAHRVLAVRLDRRRHLLAHQRHRHAVSRRHAGFRIRRRARPIPRCASASSRPTVAAT